MKFKVGDKVRVREDLDFDKDYGRWSTPALVDENLLGEIVTINMAEDGVYLIKEDNGSCNWVDEMLEPIEDPLAKKIKGRNSKSTKEINEENLLNTIQPDHYKNGDKDLFDELYERLYHSKKMFTGREVFIIVMKFVAERYTRRYPNKNAEDLEKGIYTLERLKEYEEQNK